MYNQENKLKISYAIYRSGVGTNDSGYRFFFPQEIDWIDRKKKVREYCHRLMGMIDTTFKYGTSPKEKFLYQGLVISPYINKKFRIVVACFFDRSRIRSMYSYIIVMFNSQRYTDLKQVVTILTKSPEHFFDLSIKEYITVSGGQVIPNYNNQLVYKSLDCILTSPAVYLTTFGEYTLIDIFSFISSSIPYYIQKKLFLAHNINKFPFKRTLILATGSNRSNLPFITIRNHKPGLVFVIAKYVLIKCKDKVTPDEITDLIIKTFFGNNYGKDYFRFSLRMRPFNLSEEDVGVIMKKLRFFKIKKMRYHKYLY